MLRNNLLILLQDLEEYRALLDSEGRWCTAEGIEHCIKEIEYVLNENFSAGR